MAQGESCVKAPSEQARETADAADAAPVIVIVPFREDGTGRRQLVSLMRTKSYRALAREA